MNSSPAWTKLTNWNGCSEERRVARRKHPDNRSKATPELAYHRGVAALTCVNALSPGLDASGERRMVKQILTVSDGKDRSVRRQQITDAQIVEMVWRHSQFVFNQTGKCPLLVLGRQLAEEINECFTWE
jgi:hypothetical protein